jgi:ATP-dependent Clp protease ATP-binding subunit ClpA
MFERFTRSARDAVVSAQDEARRLSHDQVLAEDLLLAVLQAGSGCGALVLREHGVERAQLVEEVAALGAADRDALQAIGIDLTAVRERAEAAFGPGALDRPRPRQVGLLRRLSGTSGHLPFSAAAKRALEQSLVVAVSLEHRSLTVDHLLLGLLAHDDDPAARALQRLGAAPSDVRAQVRAHLERAA